MFTVISTSDSLEPSYSDSLIYALLLMHHVERQMLEIEQTELNI